MEKELKVIEVKMINVIKSKRESIRAARSKDGLNREKEEQTLS